MFGPKSWGPRRLSFCGTVWPDWCVDLYYAFILGISQVLKPHGIAGIIVSNRFMTTKSGASVRQALLDHFSIHHAWDLGDTKLFNAAVLPAVLLVGGKDGTRTEASAFTSIYQTSAPACRTVTDPIGALSEEGVVEVEDGRHFQVRHGKLSTSGTSSGVWRIATKTVDAWLANVDARRWSTFYDYRFHNKLYAGRRRFLTQYVEQFPLPNPNESIGKNIIAKAKQIYDHTPSPEAEQLEEELDTMVFGKSFAGASLPESTSVFVTKRSHLLA